MEDQFTTPKLLLDISDAVASIASTRDLKRVLDLILDKALNLVKANRGRIRLIDENREYLIPGVSKGFPKEHKEKKRKIGEGIAGKVAHSGNPLNISDADAQKYPAIIELLKITKDENEKKYLKSIKSELAVPLKIRDKTVGVLSVHNIEKTNAFSKDDEALLIFLANQAAIAYENARLFNALQELGIKFTRSTEEKDLLQSISEVACKLLNIPACSIWILDKEKEEFRIKANVGLAKDYVEKACIGKDDNITGEAFRTKETVEVFNIEQDDRLKYREELIQMGFKSLLAFPLLIKEEGIGTINLYTTYKHPFTKDEKDLLEIFARHAGIVIESSKLISKRGDIIKSVLEASFESYSLNALLDKIVRIGMKELDAKSCTIFLLEDDKETLRIKAGDGEIGKRLLEVNATYYVTQKRNSFKNMEEREKHVDKNLMDRKDYWRDEDKWEYRKQMVDKGKLPMGITAYVVKENQHIILHGEEVKKHPEWIGAYEKNQGEECISIVEIPLTFHGKAEGVIKIENHKERELFNNEHKRILSILVDCVVLAMERLRYEPISYKGLFGTKLLEEIISLNNQNPQSKVEINQKIEEILRKFSADIIERDIVGIDRIYKAVVEIIKKISNELGFRDKFIEIIENIAEFEPLLGPDTREHFIHQFHVFLLGYYIINKNLQIKDQLKTHLKGNESDVIKCWFLASIFHDLGYTIEKMDEWLGGYFKNMFLTGNANSNTKIIPYIFSWGDIFRIEDYASSKKMLIEFIGEKLLGEALNNKCSDLWRTIEDLLLLRQNHGIFSALILLNRLRLSTIDKKIGLNAALSIVLHAIWEEAVRLRGGHVLEFQDFPFAFLLMFCDNAHQWGRPSIKSLLKKTTDEREMIKVQLIGITVENDKVECILEYSEVIKETAKIPRPQDYWRGNIINFSICYQAEGKVFWEHRF